LHDLQGSGFAGTSFGTSAHAPDLQQAGRAADEAEVFVFEACTAALQGVNEQHQPDGKQAMPRKNALKSAFASIAG